jgi:pilus assembly protein CpaF
VIVSLLRRIEGGDEGAGAQGSKPAASARQPEESRLAEMRQRRQATPEASQRRDSYIDLKTRIQNKLLAELDPSMDIQQSTELRNTIEELYNTILAEENLILSRAERRRLFDQIVAEILGFGPLEPLLASEDITEVMTVGSKNIYIERNGLIERVPVTFEDDEHLMRIIDRIVAPLGRRIDESSPMVDARLPDGSRVNAVIPPIAIDGPALTIRKFSKVPFTVQDLINFGTWTPEVVEFLRATVISKLNIMISGGTGSGKTTLLNILSGFIPDDERIVTVENAAELQLKQEHVVRLESRPPNIEGRGEITMRDLVINSLRMRPDRIIVGEVRSGEALDLLQAMNTGHDGSLGTAHSNSPRDTLARLETMVLMAGMDLPVRAIREQIASALQLIVHQDRMRDGTRKVVKVTEVQGMEGDVIVLSDLFEFEQTGLEDGKIRGRLRPTGLRPKSIDRIMEAGINLPASVFGIGVRQTGR